MADYVQSVLDTLAMVAIVVALTRIVGLRSFSKMSSFDFALTVATGSTIATVIINPDRSVLAGLVALAAIFAVQWVVAALRRRMQLAHEAIDNTPLLLMREGKILEENLYRARVTRSDLMAKLRTANVRDFAQIDAVVMETTGDISVLHGTADPEATSRLLEGVRQ